MVRFMTEDVRNIKSGLIAFGFFMVNETYTCSKESLFNYR